jgi:hypothetical protein
MNAFTISEFAVIPELAGAPASGQDQHQYQHQETVG